MVLAILIPSTLRAMASRLVDSAAPNPDSPAFTQAVVGMAFLSADGTILKANSAFGRIVGYDDDALNQKQWETLVYAADRQAYRAQLELLATGQTSARSLEIRFVHRTGRMIATRVTSAIVQGGDAAVLIQVQQRKRPDRSPTSSAAVGGNRITPLDKLSDGILVEDDRQIIGIATPRLCEILEIADRANALVGSPTVVVESELAKRVKNPEQFRDRVAELRAAGAECRRERLDVNDGRTLERDYVPLASRGKRRSHMWVYRDATNRIQAEMFLHEQNARLRKSNGRLAALASTDPLTGLPNRRSFFERLVLSLRQSMREAKPISLALLDIDQFKEFNDRFGHLAGDDALRMFASVLRNALRPGDLLARFGGEEFTVLMPSTDAAEATFAAERYRLELIRATWPLRTVTASFGVATAIASTMREQAAAHVLIAAADAALYRSKAEGRNRITHAEEPFHG